MNSDFDRGNAPAGGAYVYIAMSDDLQAWAFRHDRQHLAKIGFSRDPQERLVYLNGRGLRGEERVRPCLNISDWRIVGQWRMPHSSAARKTEGRLKKLLAEVFEPFDRREIGPGFPAGNGETEIYRLPLQHLPVLPAIFRREGREARLIGQAVTIVEAIVAEVRRQGDRQLRFLDAADDDDDREAATRYGDRYADISEQMRDDIAAETRARDTGWAYDDD